MRKILLVFLFLLASPIIILAALASLALLVPAPKCPTPQAVNIVASLDTKSKELEKTGKTTITDSEAGYVLKQSSGEQFEDLRICFTKDHLNFSGKFKLGSISPAFYVSSTPKTEGKLQFENTRATVGGLGFLSGFFGNIAEGLINDQVAKIPQDQSYKIQIEEGKIIIQTAKSSGIRIKNPTLSK